MIRIILAMTCLLSVTQGCGQGMSMGLSVEWRKVDVDHPVLSLSFESVTNVPYLKVTYKNLTERDLYVRKPFDLHKPHPPLSIAVTLPVKLDTEADCEQLLSAELTDDYKVELGGSWEVSQESFDTSQEHESDLINDQLLDIYKLLDMQASMNVFGMQQQLLCFNYSNKAIVGLREASRLILNEKKKQGLIEQRLSTFPNRTLSEQDVAGEFAEAFVFLRPGEIYEQDVSLVAFQLLGGNYRFFLSQKSFQGHSVGRNGQHYSLPRQVNGFQLYDNAFLTNKMEIYF